MWHEARKHEKMIRGMMVDHKRRAERRKQYYDKIKKDPAEFLQVWGIKCKIQIDPAIAAAADSQSIMTTWRGNSDVIIDRFDARSHLDIIDDYENKSKSPDVDTSKLSNEPDEERMCNYERYKSLVQNEAAEISEEQCLKQIEMEEKFGPGGENTNEQKKPKEPKASIGYIYEDGIIVPSSVSNNKKAATTHESSKLPINDLLFDSDDDLENFDLTIDIDKLSAEQKTILNKNACDYGMRYGDYVRMLQKESNERFNLKQQKIVEAQKSQFSGGKSRRERRIEKERRLKDRELSPLSYIAKNEDTEKMNGGDRSSSERSRSSSSSSNRKGTALEFITSFGDAEEQTTAASVTNSNNNAASNIHKLSINKNQLMTIKALKSRRRSSSNSSTHSNTNLNLSAGVVIARKRDTESESEEDEAIKEYLKRKQDRLASSSQSSNKGKSTTASNSSFNNFHLNSSTIKDRKSDEIKSEREKLKKRMQRQINKQFKKDKEIEREKRIKDIEERRQREAELQNLTDKIRQRERRKRSHSRSRTRSRSRSRSYDRGGRRRRRRSRSYDRRSRSSSSSSSSSSTSSSSSSSSSTTSTSRSRSRSRQRRRTRSRS